MSVADRRRTINAFSGLGSRFPPETPHAASTSTPARPRMSLVHSTPIESLPSRSANTPFDWEAIRNGQPPPYHTPLGRKNTRLSMLGQTPGQSKGKKVTPRVVRRTPFLEKLINMPSQIWFDIEMLPENLPLPPQETVGRALGGVAHFLHFICRWNLTQDTSNWDDYYGGEDERSWFHWASLTSIFLIGASFTIALYLFTRYRTYRIHHHQRPGTNEPRLVDSPRARIVAAPVLDPPKDEDAPPDPLLTRIKEWLLEFIQYWKVLIERLLADPNARPKGVNLIQELDVWSPNAFEKAFFCVYSPAHALTWLVFSFNNWILFFFLMGVLWAQAHWLIAAYDGLMKDRNILSSEVLGEYDKKFVNPRLFSVKKDASTQTSQAEMVTMHDWVSGRPDRGERFPTFHSR